MLDDIELVPVPSREAVLADLEVLATDFGRLFATDCECHLQTDRDYWPSRFAESDESILPKWFGRDGANDWDHYLSGDGLNVEPTGSKTPEDYDRAPVFYDRSGRPFVNSVGQSLITAPGWHDSHEIKLRGPGSLRAAETIERANDLVIDAAACFAGVLWPGWALSMRGFCWPNVVDRVAELANQSTLKPNDWYVKAGGQSYGLSVWRRRDEFTLGGPMVAPEIAERIGDNPEHVWAVRRAFLRDAEMAARWLIGSLAESSGDEIEADGSVGSAALGAVVAGGLAGVLQAAVGARAVDRVTAIIRERVAADGGLRSRKADHWAAELRVTKKTVTDSVGWREIMKWRAANRADRVSKKTGK